eukprot:4782308-Amphidinium_carterae.1
MFSICEFVDIGILAAMAAGEKLRSCFHTTCIAKDTEANLRTMSFDAIDESQKSTQFKREQ